jgi:hypothetical protein
MKNLIVEGASLTKKIIIVLLSTMVFITACSNTENDNKEEINNKDTSTNTAQESENKVEFGISSNTYASDFGRGVLNELPSYDPNGEDYWQIDLRGYDISELNLKDRVADLLYSDFDSKTKWPKELPKDFNPDEIMENGKNPGLQVKKLHEKGIKGKNVGIAIIDSTPLTSHVEYADSLKMYEELNNLNGTTAHMHGSAVSSIAVGKSVGVAPEADLYYIASTAGTENGSEFVYDFNYLAQCIDRIVEVNKTLEDGYKIRVISISLGWDKSQKGYDEINAAVDRATKEGIFVISTSSKDIHGFFFHGLGKEPTSNPDDFSSYKPGLWWEKMFYDNSVTRFLEGNNIKDMLLIPMDSRTTASPTGEGDYVFYRSGGWSWSVPYIAGIYALCCEVNPDITPEQFWKKAIETGITTNINEKGKSYELGKILSPVELIESIKIK